MILAKSPDETIAAILRSEVMTEERLRSPVRDARTVRVRRRIACALQSAGLSTVEIGELIGRTHATVHYLLSGRKRYANR